VASPEIAESGDSVVAQIGGLAPQQLHILKVTAFSADASNLWESPVVSLSPPREPEENGHGWLLVFGVALVVFLALR
jgi:hypothetical protein